LRPFSTALLAFALGLSFLANDAALAQTCVALQAELEHLRGSGSGAGSNRDRSRFERAFREQANVLARTEARARNAGCFGGSGFFFGRQPARACGVLVSKLRDMQNNLGRLDRLRRQAGDDTSPRRIRQLQRAIAARGCGLPGEDMWERPAEARRTLEPVAPFSARGTFRTLCVRTCDGYYFPISFSTTQEQFGADAQTCSAMCPGAQARLFYHANPGGSPADMLSIDGATYTSLPTAFQYRTSLNPSCSCKPAGGYSPIPVRAGAPSSPAEPQAEAGPLLPRPRPAPGEDPETLANRLGGFDPNSVGRGAVPTAAVTADGRPIRVVGPAYWGVPQQDGVVVAPVPN
jgi:hypothetical protein